MKDLILKYLLENTELVNKASGGNDPSVISFKFSEEEDKETFLSRIAEEISATAKKNTESINEKVKLKDDNNFIKHQYDD